MGRLDGPRPAGSGPYLLNFLDCRPVRVAAVRFPVEFRSSHASQSARSMMTICRLWIGATSGLGAVVSIVKAAPSPCGIGRHRPAKQNHSSPVFVNFHLVLGDFVPVKFGGQPGACPSRPNRARPYMPEQMLQSPPDCITRAPHIVG